jgi:acyl dehydratase
MKGNVYRCYEDISEGDELPPIEDVVSYRRVIMTPGATWDYFPGHNDPAYARAQGQPTIYLNSMHVMGFVDRLVTEWTGPTTFVVRRRVRLHRPLYAGDTLIGTGSVTAKHREEADGRVRYLIDADVSVTNQEGANCASGSITAAVPSRTTSRGRIGNQC